MGSQSSASTNTSAFQEVMKDINNEILKLTNKLDLQDDQLKAFEKKNKEVINSLENFERQILQFNNISKSINDKFKSNTDRIIKIEKQLSDFLDTSGSFKNMEEENNKHESLSGGMPSNIDVSQFATTQGLQDFKSTVYKQILKLSVELDDK